MKTKIYALVHPVTNEVVYVGQTTKTLVERLKGHYWKLNEANRGQRIITPLFKYLNDLKPLEVSIVLLDEVDSNEANEAEVHYIKESRKTYPNLLNETDGGIGGNTMKNKSEVDKLRYRNKLSESLKGKPKPEGFSEYLSEVRTGEGNPMAKPLNPKIVALRNANNNSIVAIFDYTFEINNFLDNRHAGNNISRQLKKGRTTTTSYGYVFRYIREGDYEKLQSKI